MSDVDCPYCGVEQEINHDEGYGCEEGVSYEQECRDCEKYFVFTTAIIFHYNAYKADCLNGSDHKWKKKKDFLYPDSKMCTDCGLMEKGKIDKDGWDKYRNSLKRG